METEANAMERSRRHFLKGLGSIVSVLVGGTQLAGCLGESGAQQDATTQPEAQSSAAASGAAAGSPVSQPAASPPLPNTADQNAPAQQSAANAGPVWQPSPTIDFVEGVPATVSIRGFVSDPNSDPLVISLNSGTLPPGITWNPTNATLAYDGRPLGARAEAPVVVTGVTFAADDQKI